MRLYIELISAGLLFIGISVLAYQLIALSQSVKRADTGSVRSDSFLLHIIMPLLAVLAPLNAKLRFNKYRSAIIIKFRKAGGVQNITVDLFLAAKELSTVTGIIFYLILFKMPTSGLSLTVMLSMALLGWFIPNLILNGHIKDREKKIIRELPYILDLLTVSVEAGLDFMQAVERVVQVLKKGVLVQELGIMHKGLQMGDTRKAVLRQLAYRTEVADVKAVVSALIQADQLGTGIGTVLRTVSSQARTQRSQRAEKMAGEATVKLLFPLMLIFAAVMLIILGPVALQILMTLRSH
jgi:tight adherence protein C